jgi:hypothetical protein
MSQVCPDYRERDRTLWELAERYKDVTTNGLDLMSFILASGEILTLIGIKLVSAFSARSIGVGFSMFYFVYRQIGAKIFTSSHLTLQFMRCRFRFASEQRLASFSSR